MFRTARVEVLLASDSDKCEDVMIWITGELCGSRLYYCCSIKPSTDTVVRACKYAHD